VEFSLLIIDAGLYMRAGESMVEEDCVLGGMLAIDFIV
jgi:hypothetical protein